MAFCCLLLHSRSDYVNEADSGELRRREMLSSGHAEIVRCTKLSFIASSLSLANVEFVGSIRG
jgi:hypothetical protein